LKPSEILPNGSRDWRENFAQLAPDMAASPLLTRQLRRSTARQIAKGVGTMKREMARKKPTMRRPRPLANVVLHD
jgi:hypothetical protein